MGSSLSCTTHASFNDFMFLLSIAGFLVLVLGRGAASFSLRLAQLRFNADCNFFWYSNMFRN